MTKLFIDRAGNYPLVFKDMYNEPSCFMFYGDRQCYAFNTIRYKKTQYNYLPQLENIVQGKTVAFISTQPVNKTSKEIDVPGGKSYFITIISDFASFNTSIKVQAIGFPDVITSLESEVNFTLNYTVKGSQKTLFRQKKAALNLTFINPVTKESFSYKYDKDIDLSDARPLTFRFKAPAKKGNYICVFSIVSNPFLTGFNSNIYNCRVE